MCVDVDLKSKQVCVELSVSYILKKHKLYLVCSLKGILQQVGKYTYSLSCRTFSIHGVIDSLLQVLA